MIVLNKLLLVTKRYILSRQCYLLLLWKKLLLEAINHIKNLSKKKPTTERLQTYINKTYIDKKLHKQIAMKLL